LLEHHPEFLRRIQAKVVGVGGVFFKSSHPRRLAKWYSKWLGITLEMKAAASFRPRDMPEVRHET